MEEASLYNELMELNKSSYTHDSVSSTPIALNTWDVKVGWVGRK